MNGLSFNGTAGGVPSQAAPGQTQRTVMRKIIYVDREMCGGEDLPGDFDLEDFCEILQGKLGEVEVVPVTEPEERAWNRGSSLITDSVFYEALGEYCHR